MRRTRPMLAAAALGAGIALAGCGGDDADVEAPVVPTSGDTDTPVDPLTPDDPVAPTDPLTPTDPEGAGG